MNTPSEPVCFLIESPCVGGGESIWAILNGLDPLIAAFSRWETIRIVAVFYRAEVL